MEHQRLPGGLWPVMLTPFEPNGKIDHPALEELTDFYVEHGAAGLFANCLSSEMFHLKPEEMLTVVGTVLKQTNGNIPVIATATFGYETGDHIRLIREMYDLGVAAVVMVTSQIARETDDDSLMMMILEKIMGQTGEIPLGLYECPEPYKRLIEPDKAGELANSGRFLYYKETSCNTRVIREKLEAIRGSVLRLFNANTPTALESLHEGAHGLSPISANYYPELFELLYRMGSSGLDTEEATMLQQYLAIMDAVTRIKYPLSAKLFLSWRGLRMDPVTRIKVPPLNYEEIRMLEFLYDQYRMLAERFNLVKW